MQPGQICDAALRFEPWYGKTVAPPTDPNLLYATRHELDPYGVLWPEEIEKAIALLLTSGDHGRVHAALQPAIDRFFALEHEDQEKFRDALNRFVRIYSFLSQVVAFTDTKLERDYLFCKALSSFVKPSAATGMDLGSQVSSRRFAWRRPSRESCRSRPQRASRRPSGTARANNSSWTWSRCR